ncbi:hypothetical protein [Parasphingorhabdus halotolerans]|uniref:Uncharacterized protein n=1 Tax=Parasphingorhabdus halotolerans TaxID=2725558 RepID=A0A6H2DNY7_9SPHN|nr:hypothetical protein [Parasphingorhabdus halotolerans]QJB69908.1 hypothetical protein HF685_11945 [Parasphingorhabdus halotolerans]
MGKRDYGGMTVNERLFASGLLDDFDRALAKGDKAAIEDILEQVDVDPNLAKSLLRDGC